MKGVFSMKKLSMFQLFDFGGWAANKSFMVQSAKFNSKKSYVTLDVIIIEDNTNYGDTNITNVLRNSRYTAFRT